MLGRISGQKYVWCVSIVAARRTYACRATACSCACGYRLLHGVPTGSCTGVCMVHRDFGSRSRRHMFEAC